MKLKTQTEILEDKTTNYKTKYQEIDQELITEIREICPIETTIPKRTMRKKLQKGGRKSKKNPVQKTTWLKNLPQQEKKENEKKKKKKTRPKGK